jgi:hypothetical protein
MLKKICIYLVSAIIIANILFMSNSTLESNAIGGIVFDIDTALQQGTNNVFRLVDNTRGVGSARRDDNWRDTDFGSTPSNWAVTRYEGTIKQCMTAFGLVPCRLNTTIGYAEDQSGNVTFVPFGGYSASSNYSPQYSPAKAFDGNSSTYFKLWHLWI